jgi:hypothetical protein
MIGSCVPCPWAVTAAIPKKNNPRARSCGSGFFILDGASPERLELQQKPRENEGKQLQTITGFSTSTTAILEKF